MLASSLAATAYLQAAPMSSRVAAAPRADVVRMAANEQQWKAAGLAAALALATGIQSASAGPFTRSEIASLTYDQIKGTGLANTCPRVESASAEPIKLSSGKKCKPPPDPLSAHASPLLFGLGGPRLGRHCDALGRGTPQGRGVMDPAPSPRTTRLWAVVWLSSRRHEVARGGRGQPVLGRRPTSCRPSPRVDPALRCRSPAHSPRSLCLPLLRVCADKIDEFCLEPTSFQVLEEKLTKTGLVTEPVNTKVTTRQTYVLTGIEGDLVQDGGKIAFIEKDGIDYAPTTVQLPGGERVPFLFTVKNLVAKSDVSTSEIGAGLKLSGGFKVPSYRTGLFLDPKGRGTTTGYDQAIALPAMQAGGDDQMFKENNKKFDVLDGSIELKVTSVNAALGEIGGVFVQKQPSDTDLGSKVPKDLLLKGSWFATVNEQ